ncbi:MAG: magnesium chelatase subunit H [Proteobacteria bacterium]|nr:magnesium chelatase subunit H [Pseudomonadota bacterium]
MQKLITADEAERLRVVLITLDGHLASVVDRVQDRLRRAGYAGLELSFHIAADWHNDNAELERCLEAIETGDIIFVNMLFIDEHIRAVLPALQARRDTCDAMIGCIAAPEVVKLTRLGRFRLDKEASGAMALLKRLRGTRKADDTSSSAAAQMRMLRRLPKILRFIPGTAQDARSYFLAMQYWLSGSDENIEHLIRFLIDSYADGARRKYRGLQRAKSPVVYPEVGLYHPDSARRITENTRDLPRRTNAAGTVGLLLMRSYLLAGNAVHYDGVIRALEAKGLNVIPAFASGLDARPAIESFFIEDGRPIVDAVVSLTGFSLVGGPAYNNAQAAEEMLARLDIPYIAALPVEFQTLEQWRGSAQGLLPIEATVMVAIPELDGATGSMVFGGRSSAAQGSSTHDMQPEPERIGQLAARVERLIALRRADRSERRIAIVLFNFPPNAGATGTAAFLSVYESLFNTLAGLARAGYRVEMPESADALRRTILEGNAKIYGAGANVHARVKADEIVRSETWLKEIEAQWGPAPGKHNSDGSAVQILGCQFGNVFIGVQPAFGYEGDPMRLLFEKGFAPTHAFSTFYRWLREDFKAHAVLHFGTHGALEFMPGKQAGLSGACWPDRLIGDMPNFYLYAANNPSEGALAKRRSAATLISYLTPSVTNAGLYRGLLELKALMADWRQIAPSERADRRDLLLAIQAHASSLELAAGEPAWEVDKDEPMVRLANAIIELEYTLIPNGLHVVGAAMPADERRDLLAAVADATRDGEGRVSADLDAMDTLLQTDSEIPAIIGALDGRYVRPAPGGDLIRTPAVLPTGRNLHGFDPFRIPAASAVIDGVKQVERLIDRCMSDGTGLPETVAIVLWGTDNLKSGGGPIAQVLALLGAIPRFDSYGRLAGAELLPLETLGRPRIDVIVTLSGIFRDLLPLQIRLLAEAAFLAAAADEPSKQNFVRKHALAYQAETGCALESAALRVFSNAEGAYGSNVNHLVESSRWDEADELAETYSRRKCFAYGRKGQSSAEPQLLDRVLADVDVAYQNLESVELGVTTVDTYFDTLGGIAKRASALKGSKHGLPVYIGDQTRREGRVRKLEEQVALETRTRILNPKWIEGLLKHGYEGVRQIEAHVTNTMGWSATTGQVPGWVYRNISETYVLDPEMRERLAALNPQASARMVGRLLEAHRRQFWAADPETLAALEEANDELEDRIEGISSNEAVA